MKPYFLFSTFILFFVSLLLSINIFSLNPSWYTNKFKSIGVYDQLPQSRVNDQLFNLLNYLKNDEDLNNSYYTEKEILHLKDIKKLIAIANLSLVITGLILLVILIYALKKKELQKIILISSTGAILIYIFIGLLIHLQFDKIFLKFHEIVFTNDYWILDPDIDKLIIIFPPELFFDLISSTIIVSFLNLIILALSFLFTSRFIKIK